jgi:cytochrome c556
MDRPFMVRAGVVVLAVAVAAGCASMKRMKPEEAIAERQQLMKDQGALMRSIGDKAKAGQIQAIAPEAAKLEDSAKKITRLFPENSVNPNTSRAKPEIWQKWSEFEGLAKSLQTKSDALEKTAQTGDAQKTQVAVAELGKTTCGACHTQFRGPEIKK